MLHYFSNKLLKLMVCAVVSFLQHILRAIHLIAHLSFSMFNDSWFSFCSVWKSWYDFLSKIYSLMTTIVFFPDQNSFLHFFKSSPFLSNLKLINSTTAFFPQVRTTISNTREQKIRTFIFQTLMFLNYF